MELKRPNNKNNQGKLPGTRAGARVINSYIAYRRQFAFSGAECFFARSMTVSVNKPYMIISVEFHVHLWHTLYIYHVRLSAITRISSSNTSPSIMLSFFCVG